MSASFFLDTGMLVCAFDSSAPPKRRIANQLIASALATRGAISYQVAQEFLNLATRKFARPLSAAEAEQFLITVLKPLMMVQSSPALFLEALRIASTASLAWHDALVVAAAAECRAPVLYSEDLPHGRRFGGVRIENPFRNA